jgi:hypothetical protein
MDESTEQKGEESRDVGPAKDRMAQAFILADAEKIEN